jgi:hypothetical protein
MRCSICFKNFEPQYRDVVLTVNNQIKIPIRQARIMICPGCKMEIAPVTTEFISGSNLDFFWETL